MHDDDDAILGRALRRPVQRAMVHAHAEHDGETKPSWYLRKKAGQPDHGTIRSQRQRSDKRSSEYDRHEGRKCQQHVCGEVHLDLRLVHMSTCSALSPAMAPPAAPATFRR